ncbi:hypothetical protein M9Y10_043819 [Tritrichomonas musculus]|uniref:Bromo domain-containing protein n=1 Tax=Tritrichomonas musculus TaxID=1915356 RepID=A0ABR2GLE1_9EUKA
MSLSKFQSEKCLKIVDKLISFSICVPFVEMVDPVNDGVQDYYDIIKNPMSLNEVRKRIVSKKYKDISEFQKDINLIWSNARKYNGDDNVITNMAMEASCWFDKQMKQFPQTQEEEWLRKMQKIVTNFFEAIKHPPHEICPEKLNEETESRGNLTQDTDKSEEKDDLSNSYEN